MKKTIQYSILVAALVIAGTAAQAQSQLKTYNEAAYAQASQTVLTGNWEISTDNNTTIVKDEHKKIIVITGGKNGQVSAYELAVDKTGNLHIIGNTATAVCYNTGIASNAGGVVDVLPTSPIDGIAGNTAKK